MDNNLFDEVFGLAARGQLGKDQSIAFDTVLHNQDKNFFITGAAGTGKSTLLRYISENAKNAVVVAPTGIASLNAGGQTIHSFFKLPIGIITKKEIKHHGNDFNMVRPVKLLIIDEISMVSSMLLDAIDMSLRVNKGSDLPFGGAQVIMIGDLNQLPPVVTADDAAYMYKTYKSPYFFDSMVLRNARPQKIVLNEIFRQKDELFISILNKIKDARVTQADLDIVNDICHKSDHEHDPNIINLCTVNRQADYINEKMMNLLTTPEHIYIGELTGEFRETNVPVPMRFVAKEGCRIMFRNNDLEKRWFNGSLGTVTQIKSDCIVVLLDNGMKHHVSPHTWELKKYRLDKMTGQMASTVVGTYTQYPMVIAYACSIHKSQGCTFENVHIDLVDGAFASGQTYVALSRATTLQGMTLARPVAMSDIIYDQKILDFLRS